MSEPYARVGHFSWSVGGRTLVWGGHNKKKAFDPTSLEEFNSYTESWTKTQCYGRCPRGYRYGAHTASKDRLFTYGGLDVENAYHGDLRELNAKSLEWSEVSPASVDGGPMKKYGAGMVLFGDGKLALFGGYGVPTGPAQPGSSFVRNDSSNDGSGWTNEFHVFDLHKRVWSCPALSGTRPPPGAQFTLTSIDPNRAVVFAGYQADLGITNETYLLNFLSMECTKLEPVAGQPLPLPRRQHAACCLNFGSDRPQVFVAGGIDSGAKVLGDAWMLDAHTGGWRQVPTEGEGWKRTDLSLTAHSLGPGVTEVLLFGGDCHYTPIAGTTTLLLECPHPEDGSSSSSPEQWALTDVARLPQLATAERLARKEALRSKNSPAVSESTHKEPVVIPFSDLHLGKEVGEGTFGVVRKGYRTSLDGRRHQVAIKQLKGVDKFEVEILSSLDHPNIITLYGTSENNGLLYLVTDYAENGSLHDFISERPCSPDLKRTLPWAKQVAEGMLYLHHRGIVHRDLKSNNVVLTSEWVAKICDLGTARASDHTTLMSSVGTMAWIAPEIMMKKPASKPCDMYSYGVLLWELVTHDQPFKDHPPLLIPSEVVKGERPPIPESTDVAVKELIEKCWQTKPEDRPVFESVLYSLEEYEMGKMEYGELEVTERAGEGAFGVVFRGFWNTKKAGKISVAIKNLPHGDLKEVIVLSSLRHPNFIHFYGCVKSKLHLSLVTEFAENGSIGDYISERKGRPERERALKWGREIAEGMQYLHERGFAHRDLKSCNVVLTSEWTAKICDMGTAKQLKNTVQQTLAGTIAWIAPELLMEQPASKKCDVYSYAIILWELATFELPFEGVGELMIPEKVLNGERLPIPSDCDQFLSSLIRRCWVGKYEERPSFDAIIEDWP